MMNESRTSPLESGDSWRLGRLTQEGNGDQGILNSDANGIKEGIMEWERLGMSEAL